MNILGISAFYHDSAACLVRDGKIIAAAQEERFTRKKHDWEFPTHAVEYCLKTAGITAKDLDCVVFYDKPFLKFERLLETHLDYAPKGWLAFLKAMPVWVKQKIWVKELIREELDDYKGLILFPEHHQSHAASAFYPSPFESAAFLTVDGVGEWATTSFGTGKDHRIDIHSEIHFPHSLGLLYSAFTYYCGFKVNSGEYKLMGLAPYGEAKYKDLILKHLIEVKPDGSFKLRMEYFDYCVGSVMTSSKFHDLFGGPPRKPESKITQKDMDLAKSVQEALEEILLLIVSHVRKTTGQKNLCLAGGVALNCVANGRILREGGFEKVWIQPAAGDAGGALGAALFAWHHYYEKPRSVAKDDAQAGSYLGPEYSNDEIASYLKSEGAPFELMGDVKLVQEVAHHIAQEKVIGWFQGRMEFGPRALGSRSIIGDARSPRLQEVMNLKIKFRESFRPFAPSIKAERVHDYFELNSESPYMMIVAPVKASRRKQVTAQESQLFGIEKLKVPRSDVPAITHVDYSARIQTVHRQTNRLYHDLLTQLEQKENCPLVINTSFNVRGEPIVLSPQDAYRCFMRTNIDVLVLGNCVLLKEAQPKRAEDERWMKEFALD